jgi:uncharacterized protein (DUF1330 family)
VIAVFEVRMRAGADAAALERYAAYKARVAPLILQAGGTYLARAATGEFLEGDPADGAERVFHVIEFPSAEAAHEFWSSEAYAEIIPLREAAVDVRAVLIGH